MSLGMDRPHADVISEQKTVPPGFTPAGFTARQSADGPDISAAGVCLPPTYAAVSCSNASTCGPS
jgi:hypothetical protein